jgi:PAS domain S-box-containing protein
MVMYFIYLISRLDSLTFFQVAMLDSILITMLVLPSLYFFIFRPLTIHIAARKKVEEDLRLSQFSIEHASICAYLVDPEAHFLYVNEQACRTLGYNREELLSMTMHDLDPDFPTAVWPRQWAILKKKGGLHFETSHRRKDGTLVPMEMTLNFLAFGGREYNVAFGLEISERKKAEEAVKQAYAGLEEKVRERTQALTELNSELRQEISERQRAEEALQASEKRFRDLIEATSDWVWEVDDRGVYTYASPQVSRILGYEPEEVLGRTIFDLMPAEEAERLAHFLDEIVASRKPIFLLEIISLRKNGTRVVMESSGVPLFDAARNFRGYRGIDRDITERKKAEEELQRAQKLESIGLLAGGIAHDFNNMLTAIKGNIELAQRFLPPGDKAAARLAVAEQASDRASGLARQLLTFAKGGAPITRTTDVPHLVRESVELALRGSIIKGEYCFPRNLLQVKADESQLNQAISNIAINAVQAMPNGGIITAAAVNLSLPENNTLDLPAGQYVRIDIKDQGNGITEKIKGRIFDLYFTTKKQGSGLGLAITYSIVKRHGGTITVESIPGEGSTFSVFLPASKKMEGGPKTEKPEEVESGTGRILVMDDEEAVSEVAAEMLENLGYQAETVKDGAEAITAYRQALAAGEPFDAIITDLTVPAGMGGKETVRHLLEFDPQARVIVSSGYANNTIMSDYLAYGFKGVIPKPFRLIDLSKTLKEVLGQEK